MGIVITDLAKFCNLSGGTHVSVEGRSGLGGECTMQSNETCDIEIKISIINYLT